jgi:hypothetical protein
MSLVRKIARNIRRLATQQVVYTTQASTRRSNRNLIEHYNDSVDQTIAAIRAKRLAETERDCALQLVQELARDRETYRRMFENLRQGWQPATVEEQVYQQQQAMEGWIEATKQEVAMDDAWQQDFVERLERVLVKARQRAQ